MSEPEIRFNLPSIEGDELLYMEQAVQQGHTSASGPFSQRVATLLGEELGSEDVLLTTSCTDALEMAAMLLDLQPGDTVIVPSFTHVSTALAFAREGARLLFCDIEPRTLGLDPERLSELLDPTVRAVVTVHYAGIGCDVDGLRDVLADWPGVSLIEDAAHALFGTYRGRPLGSFGRFATLSFHETKNFICGEGGALLVNRPDDVDRAHVLYDKGTNRRAFMLGQVDKYSWRDIGSSFGLSDVLAAYLYGQLEQRESILEKRRRVYERYRELLAPEAEELGIQLPSVPAGCTPAYHMFHVLLESREQRGASLHHMRAQGVHPTFHYVPLHDSEGAKRHLARPSPCPVTEDVSGRLLRLPFYNSMSSADLERVVELLVASIRELRPSAAR
jgi:dTDP-4-amino-4,6-dideoxygalactose transaminase